MSGILGVRTYNKIKTLAINKLKDKKTKCFNKNCKFTDATTLKGIMILARLVLISAQRNNLF